MPEFPARLAQCAVSKRCPVRAGWNECVGDWGSLGVQRGWFRWEVGRGEPVVEEGV